MYTESLTLRNLTTISAINPTLLSERAQGLPTMASNHFDISDRRYGTWFPTIERLRLSKQFQKLNHVMET